MKLKQALNAKIKSIVATLMKLIVKIKKQSFSLVSSLAWGQYVEMSRAEPNHCQLRPDRRRCGPTFLPRWYFNPFKVNYILLQNSV